jgi:hypothetical protein
MAAVTIYVTPWCPYCVRAKGLLKRKGVAFTEVDVSDDPASRAWLVQATGQRTPCRKSSSTTGPWVAVTTCTPSTGRARSTSSSRPGALSRTRVGRADASRPWSRGG